jgi:hypothetical protein
LVASVIYKYKARLERLSRGIHFSLLLAFFVSDEEKSLVRLTPMANVKKLFAA